MADAIPVSHHNLLGVTVTCVLHVACCRAGCSIHQRVQAVGEEWGKGAN